MFKQIRGIHVWIVVAAALIAAGCDKHKDDPTPPAQDMLSMARKAAESGVRATVQNPESVQFRGVEVWPQAVENQFAVCGQTNVFGVASLTHVLFVAVVYRNDGAHDPERAFRVASIRIGASTSEASKAYVDTIARCYDRGGPQPIPRESVTPVPPMPEGMAEAQVAITPLPAPPIPPTPVPPTPANAAASTTPSRKPMTANAALGSVTMRHNANIRAEPRGETIRVANQGDELRVFAQAPGGWLQVGTDAPSGWVQSSLTDWR